jgi:hypothetical protein
MLRNANTAYNNRGSSLASTYLANCNTGREDDSTGHETRVPFLWTQYKAKFHVITSRDWERVGGGGCEYKNVFFIVLWGHV